MIIDKTSVSLFRSVCFNTLLDVMFLIKFKLKQIRFLTSLDYLSFFTSKFKGRCQYHMP